MVQIVSAKVAAFALRHVVCLALCALGWWRVNLLSRQAPAAHSLASIQETSTMLLDLGFNRDCADSVSSAESGLRAINLKSEFRG